MNILGERIRLYPCKSANESLFEKAAVFSQKPASSISHINETTVWHMLAGMLNMKCQPYRVRTKTGRKKQRN